MPDGLEYRDYQHRDFEYRETDTGLGVVSGTIVKYGDVARFPWGTEEVAPGAYGNLAGRFLYANRMHIREQPLGNTANGRVSVTDSKEALRGEVTIPDTSTGRDTAYEVADGILRGLSKEFRATDEEFEKQHRIIKAADLFGFGVVDRPAYPQSGVSARSWDEYFEIRGIVQPPGSPAGQRGDAAPSGLGEVDWEDFGAYDDLGRFIIHADIPVRLQHHGEDRQMPRIEGFIPYNVEGVVSMARNEHLVFLPGVFGDSLAGEILLLAGNSYDAPLAGTAARSLELEETEEGLRFRSSPVPPTSTGRDFAANLRANLIRGVTAGWALQGSETETTPLEGGGNLITVRKAMLCELRTRTRSVFPGEIIAPARRRYASPLMAV